MEILIKEKDVIENDMFWYYFVILELAFRMIILEDISIVPNNEMEENLFAIHDWIKDSLEKQGKHTEGEYKSIAYGCRELKQKLENEIRKGKKLKKRMLKNP